MTLEHAVEYIADTIRRAEKASDIAKVKEFAAQASDREIVAVDGGSTVVLDACDFIVGAYRAGHARYKQGRPGSMSVPAPEIALISKEDASGMYSKAYSNLTGTEPASVESDPAHVLSLMREITEVTEVSKLIDALPTGSLIVLDGSLDFGSMLPEKFTAELKERLDRKDISLLAVSKSTSLRANGVPFNLAFLRVKSASAWFSPVKVDGLRIGSCYAVRFHPASRRVFRVDVHSLDIERALGTLAHYADDPFYPGYPYPLAQIHNKVSITMHEKEEFAMEIERSVGRSAIAHEGFEALFSGFHEVLDMAR